MTIDNGEIEPDPAATRIQPNGVSLSLPALAIEAHERAATLMAGATAGGQGEVKAWTPNRGLIWGRLGWGILLILMAPDLWNRDWQLLPGLGFLNPFLCIMMASMGIGFIASAVKSLRTPAFLSTDESGLALAAAKGGRALRWDDIASFAALKQQIGSSSLVLYLKSGEKEEIDLSGYPDQSKRQLLSFMERKLKKGILFGDPSVIGHCRMAGLFGGDCGAPAHVVDEWLGYAVCNFHLKVVRKNLEVLQEKRRKALPGGRRMEDGGEGTGREATGGSDSSFRLHPSSFSTGGGPNMGVKIRASRAAARLTGGRPSAGRRSRIMSRANATRSRVFF